MSEKARLLRLRHPFEAREVSLVELASGVPPLPPGCANCLEPAANTRHEEHRGRSLLVPYCTRCFLACEREGTLRFGGVLASLVLGVTLLLTLPRLWPSAGLLGYALLSLAGTLIPIALVLALGRAPRSGQSSGGRAVWWQGPKRIACTSEGWAAQLAAAQESTPERRRVREPFPYALLAVPAVTVALAPMLHAFQHPEVVVLNLGDAPFVVAVDGRRVARVGVTSLESPTAGVHLRLAAGLREVALFSEQGEVLVRTRLTLEPGRTHLYAPLSEEHCFWLERDAYGKATPPEARYRPLPDGTRFWTLPRDVDTWFAKNPNPSSDHRSTGGTLVALRHARCAEAPEGVQ